MARRKRTGAAVVWLALATVPAGLPAAESTPENTLSAAERRAGWRLLFDGESLRGWRNFRSDSISPGWKVSDGALVRAAAGAGDIVSTDEFEWFELQLDYRISPGGNSGIMFRVTEDGPQPWHSGPEVQVLDNSAGKDPQRAGWLYGLYPARTDPLTKEPIDTTRPAGEWNTISLRIVPEQCGIVLNGVRYASFKIGSPEWNEKVAASKFAGFPQFGRALRGRICLQDHGDEVAYRNIRIRELRAGAPPPDPIDGTLDVGFTPAFPGLRWEGYDALDEQGRPQTFRPVLVTHAGDGSGRIFVVEQHGVIHVIEPGAAGSRPTASRIFADLRDRVVYADKQIEEGLLGLAFHPQFAATGECFVYYTSKRHDPHTSVVARFRTTDDGRRIDVGTEEELLVVPQPFWNHNGGTVVFGPDAKLYVALGDGGSGNDPHGHAQNLGTLFGSILRIDIDRRDPGLAYAIPPDNPFVGTVGARGEIWAHGLRNVWRMAFDRATGQLWAADVGQGTYEEIDVIVRGGNYAWNLREGRHAFGPRGSGPRGDLIEPVFEYDHSVGASITGGFVYRGRSVPQLEGRYLYADYVSGKLFALSFDPVKGVATANHAIPSQRMPVLSWGEDEDGEAYFMVASNDGQGIYRLVAAGAPAAVSGPDKVRLWPEGAPGAQGDADIDQPFVEVWRPDPARATGAAFVICPGGGYGHLAADHEGRQVATWCTDVGAVAFVLHYRLGSNGYHYPMQLLDVQRALRFARAHADRYGIAPDRIGVFGFSAGGHLASLAATLFDEKPAGGTADAIDGVSARPDVAILAYPVIALAERHSHKGSRKNLLGPADTDDLARTLSTDRRVTAATPPTFIFQTDEDPGVPAENAVAFYLACRRHGVPAELHVYGRGPHGVGLARGDHTLGRWSDLLHDWLRDRGFFRPGERVAVQGRATIDGMPVSWGTVTFRSDDPLVPVASARIRNGSFSVAAADGPVVGPVAVTVCASVADIPGLDTADGTITFTESAPGAGPWRLVIDPGQPALDLSIHR